MLTWCTGDADLFTQLAKFVQRSVIKVIRWPLQILTIQTSLLVWQILKLKLNKKIQKIWKEIGKTRTNLEIQIEFEFINMHIYIIDCHTVKNSDCKEIKPATPPVCGRVKNFNFEVIRFENENSNDNATVKIKFDPTTLRDR